MGEGTSEGSKIILGQRAYEALCHKGPFGQANATKRIRGRTKEIKWNTTYEALQVLSVLAAETPVRLPYPTPTGGVSASRREEDDCVVGLDCDKGQ